MPTPLLCRPSPRHHLVSAISVLYTANGQSGVSVAETIVAALSAACAAAPTPPSSPPAPLASS